MPARRSEDKQISGTLTMGDLRWLVEQGKDLPDDYRLVVNHDVGDRPGSPATYSIMINITQDGKH